jgi:hypothetical protein
VKAGQKWGPVESIVKKKQGGTGGIGKGKKPKT